MKTDASFIKRKHKADATQAVASLCAWAKNQLSIVKNEQRLPVCFPLGKNSLMVGNYRVEKISDRVWQVKDHNHSFVHNFVSRSSAVIYCVCAQTNQLALSLRLLKDDNQLGLLETSFMLLKHRFKQAQGKKDTFQLQLYAAKLTQNVAQLKEAQLSLKKTLRSAKYLKLWENMP